MLYIFPSYTDHIIFFYFFKPQPYNILMDQA